MGSHRARVVPDAVKAAAVHALATGAATKADLARELGVSATTIAKWASEADHANVQAKVDRILPKGAPLTDAPEPGPVDVTDTLKTTRKLWSDAMTLADRAARDGNHVVAGRAIRDASDLANTIARIEATKKAQGEGITFSAREVAQAMEGLRDRMHAIASSRPLLCAHCNRALAIKESGAADKVAACLLEPEYGERHEKK